MDVAILGAGIDGLLAAHAVTQFGLRPTIFGGDKNIGVMPGVNGRCVRTQIPYITDHLMVGSMDVRPSAQPPFSVEFIENFGIAYCHKVYGRDFDAYVEKYTLRELHDAIANQWTSIFDAKAVYDRLWELYVGHIKYQWITPQWYKKAHIRSDYDIIINTTELPKWCVGDEGGKGHHVFPCSYSWVVEQARFGPLKPGSVLLEWDSQIPHYLQANMFGEWIVEYPEDTKPPMDCQRTPRPLSTNCDCAGNQHGFKLVGQLAKWDNMTLIHSSYDDTITILDEHINRPVQLELGT